MTQFSNVLYKIVANLHILGICGMSPVKRSVNPLNPGWRPFPVKFTRLYRESPVKSNMESPVKPGFYGQPGNHLNPESPVGNFQFKKPGFIRNAWLKKQHKKLGYTELLRLTQ